ncbi:MAG TPA: TetR/AcrR family transcriptional regulator C-terminal domain-containing protein [Lysobacter sp.]
MSDHLPTTLPAPDDGRRAAIVNVVADVLHARNGATSIETILTTTATSPHEVAREFGSAGALMAAVARTLAEQMLSPLEEGPTATSFRPRLIEFSRRATDEYLGLRLKNLYRIALADGTRDVAIAREVYSQGPERVHAALARFFRAARCAGVMLEADSDRLANCFMALLRTYWDLSDLRGAPDRRITERDVGGLVEVFLTGVQTEAGHA